MGNNNSAASLHSSEGLSTKEDFKNTLNLTNVKELSNENIHPFAMLINQSILSRHESSPLDNKIHLCESFIATNKSDVDANEEMETKQRKALLQEFIVVEFLKPHLNQRKAIDFVLQNVNHLQPLMVMVEHVTRLECLSYLIEMFFSLTPRRVGCSREDSVLLLSVVFSKIDMDEGLKQMKEKKILEEILLMAVSEADSLISIQAVVEFIKVVCLRKMQSFVQIWHALLLLLLNNNNNNNNNNERAVLILFYASKQISPHERMQLCEDSRFETFLLSNLLSETYVINKSCFALLLCFVDRVNNASWASFCELFQLLDDAAIHLIKEPFSVGVLQNLFVLSAAATPSSQSAMPYSMRWSELLLKKGIFHESPVVSRLLLGRMLSIPFATLPIMQEFSTDFIIEVIVKFCDKRMDLFSAKMIEAEGVRVSVNESFLKGKSGKFTKRENRAIAEAEMGWKASASLKSFFSFVFFHQKNALQVLDLVVNFEYQSIQGAVLIFETLVNVFTMDRELLLLRGFCFSNKNFESMQALLKQYGKFYQTSLTYGTRVERLNVCVCYLCILFCDNGKAKQCLLPVLSQVQLLYLLWEKSKFLIHGETLRAYFYKFHKHEFMELLLNNSRGEIQFSFNERIVLFLLLISQQQQDRVVFDLIYKQQHVEKNETAALEFSFHLLLKSREIFSFCLFQIEGYSSWVFQFCLHAVESALAECANGASGRNATLLEPALVDNGVGRAHPPLSVAYRALHLLSGVALLYFKRGGEEKRALVRLLAWCVDVLKSADDCLLIMKSLIVFTSLACTEEANYAFTNEAARTVLQREAVWVGETIPQFVFNNKDLCFSQSSLVGEFMYAKWGLFSRLCESDLVTSAMCEEVCVNACDWKLFELICATIENNSIDFEEDFLLQFILSNKSRPPTCHAQYARAACNKKRIQTTNICVSIRACIDASRGKTIHDPLREIVLKLFAQSSTWSLHPEIPLKTIPEIGEVILKLLVHFEIDTKMEPSNEWATSIISPVRIVNNIPNKLQQQQQPESWLCIHDLLDEENLIFGLNGQAVATLLPNLIHPKSFIRYAVLNWCVYCSHRWAGVAEETIFLPVLKDLVGKTRAVASKKSDARFVQQVKEYSREVSFYLQCLSCMLHVMERKKEEERGKENLDFVLICIVELLTDGCAGGGDSRSRLEMFLARVILIDPPFCFARLFHTLEDLKMNQLVTTSYLFAISACFFLDKTIISNVEELFSYLKVLLPWTTSHLSVVRVLSMNLVIAFQGCINEKKQEAGEIRKEMQVVDKLFEFLNTNEEAQHIFKRLQDNIVERSVKLQSVDLISILKESEPTTGGDLCLPTFYVDQIALLLKQAYSEFHADLYGEETTSGASLSVLNRKKALKLNELESEMDLSCARLEKNFQFLQRKIDPLTNEDGEKIQVIKRNNLIVVASLIDKIPNLAGIVRTGEVFRVREVILNSVGVVDDLEFQSISVSAEQWLPISEVSTKNLIAYLKAMKREEKYLLVGLEQTSNSKVLNEYAWPDDGKICLVLGNEKTGIPPDVLNELDVCLEIPQFGMIRSLNVHVSAALCIWQYVEHYCCA